MPSLGYIHYVLLFNKTSSLFLESSHSKKNMGTQIHGRPMKNRAATTMDLVEEDNEFEEEEEEGSVLTEESSHLKRKKLNLGKKKGKNSDWGGGLGVVVQVKHCCQVEKCGVDLDGAKKYHQRHKVCQFHAKAPVVLAAGLSQRFCQQCSRFHELSEFDGTKRSCRQRLAGHNERRRKAPLTIELEDNQSKQINGEARQHMDMTFPNRNAIHTDDISG